MSCPGLSEIYEFLERELSASDRERLEEHFRVCSRCQQLLSDRRQYLASFASLPDLELPPDFTDTVMARLPKLKSPVRLWLWLAGGIYFLFALLVIVMALGTGNLLFPICLQIFKNVFNLAAELSSLIFRAVHLIYGFIKALSILVKVSGGLLSSFLPISNLGLAAFAFSLCLSLTIFWFLVSPVKSSRGEEP